MALMLSKLHDALLASGAPPDKAQAASEEVAAYDNRLAAVDTRLAVLTWMVGANLGLVVLLVGAAFTMWAKLGDISGQLARLVH